MNDDVNEDELEYNNFLNQSLITQKESYGSTHSINADTGSTGHFIALPDAAVLLNMKPIEHGISVSLPDG